MSQADHENHELEELLNALIDGTLTAEQQSRLSQVLEDSEHARQFYVRFVGLSVSLCEYAGELLFPAPNVQMAMAPRRYQSRLPWVLGVLATAAAIVIAIVLHGVSNRDAKAEDEEFAAQITGVQDCTWTESKPAPELGDQLPHGQQLELKSGMVEITFDSGARVTLEGPATLDLNSAWEATLHRGKLRAEVSADAVGFAIQSATVDVVDLGTEFGMTVDSSGATEVCVLEGTVEATPHAPAKTEPTKFVLKERDARRFSRTGSEELKNTASILGEFKKATKLKRLTKAIKYVHWSFDEFDGRTAHADGSWLAASEMVALIETAGDVQPAESRLAGRWHGALSFDGHLHAHATVPEFSSRTAHTIAFWVRIPTVSPLADNGPIVAWLTKAQDATHVQPVQISWNSNPSQGPIGALRTDLGRLSAIGATNLRDNQWHHLAVVLVPRNTGKQRWHLRQYVDGHLEEATNKVSKSPHADALDDAADDVVWLGRAVGTLPSDQEKFRGQLDELVIVDRQLTPQQIGQLFRQNSLTASPVAEGK